MKAVAGPTLDLFWQLAAVQVENPAVGRTLLAVDPRGPAEELERLGIEIGAFRDELAEKYGVHAVVLFLAKEKDPLEAARRLPSPGVVLSAAYGPAAGPGLRRYAVRPRTWEPESLFEHVRWGVDDGAEMVTRLVYRGGFQDSRTVRVGAPDLELCPLSTTGASRAVIVEQEGRKRADRPVIVAASYVLDPYPGPLLADWIEIPQESL